MAETWNVTPGNPPQLIQPRHLSQWIKQQRRRPCSWCGKSSTAGRDIQHPTHGSIEHIQPEHQGGANTPLNIKPACRRCNNGRQICDECIGTLACALTVLGPTASTKQIGRWWSRIRKRNQLPEYLRLRALHPNPPRKAKAA